MSDSDIERESSTDLIGASVSMAFFQLFPPAKRMGESVRDTADAIAAKGERRRAKSSLKTVPLERTTFKPAGVLSRQTRSASGTAVPGAAGSPRNSSFGASRSSLPTPPKGSIGVSYTSCKSRCRASAPAGNATSRLPASRCGNVGSPSSSADHSVELLGSRTSTTSALARKRNRATVWLRPLAETIVSNSARWTIAVGRSYSAGRATST